MITFEKMKFQVNAGSRHDFVFLLLGFRCNTIADNRFIC